MGKLIFLLLTLIFAFGQNLQFAHAQNATADFWKCDSRQGGSWTVGRAANICLVEPFQKATEVEAYWPQVTYDDAKYNSSTSVRNAENSRYSSEMNNLVDGFSRQYYLRKKPNAPAAEVEAWAKAILAVSYHESIWTHYRKGSDKVMRMLRGDFGHGHGLMQVDDRWHYAYVNSGGAARIQDNIIYGLDLFYSLWNKAASASCVAGGSNYLARTRATYSMYNGGEGSVCRWRNTAHKWYKNDKNFWDHFQAQGWRKHVIAMDTFKYNFSCFVQDGGLKCFDSATPTDPVVVTPPADYKLSIEELYQLKSKSLNCTWNNSFLSCLPSNLGTQCLKDLFGIEQSKQLIDLESQTSQTITTKMINPDLKCAVSTDVAAGDIILTKMNINLRKTPGGNLVSTIQANQYFQVLDVYKNEQTKINYYLITSSLGTGYIAAGTSTESHRYAAKATSNSVKRILANEGDTVELKNTYGINMRETPDGKLQINVPRLERVVVLSRVIRGEDKHVYYRVQYKNQTGYIYSGRIAPSPNLSSWTEVK